jgi:IclR family pca regulon transcriptional regulator
VRYTIRLRPLLLAVTIKYKAALDQIHSNARSKSEQCDQQPDPYAVMPKPTSRSSYVLSLEKGLSVLSVISDHAAGLSIAETAALTGLDRAGARRLLLTLENLGFVKNGDKKFSLTPKILSLGYQYLSSLPFWQLAQPVLEELAADVKQNVSIGVLDKGDIVLVLRVSTPGWLAVDPPPGSRIPAHLTSTGQILLGSLDEAALQEYLDGLELKRLTPHTIMSKQELKRQIKAAKERGWAIVSQQSHESMTGIAMPITSPTKQIVAAITVNKFAENPEPSKTVDHIVAKLRVAARRLSGGSFKT